MSGKKKLSDFEGAQKVILDLISKHSSMREFSRAIREDPADCMQWRDGKKFISPRAVVTICQVFNIEPELLRPDLFTGVSFIFKKGK